MKRRKLPIGIQTFAKIRSEDYYYIDKTALAQTLIEEGSHYFLSRPRRFGKSLFLDTLKELFEGNEPLFQGLGKYMTNGIGRFNTPSYVSALAAKIYNNAQSLQYSLHTQLKSFRRTIWRYSALRR